MRSFSRLTGGRLPTLAAAGVSSAARKLGLLCLFIAVAGALPFRVTPGRAPLATIVAASLLVVVGLLVFSGAWAHARRVPLVDETHVAATRFLELVRLAGLPLLAGVFFLLWTFVYLELWRIDSAAFDGLAAHPRYADFVYYSVSTAFIAPPADIVAHGQAVRVATMLEMVTGFAVLAAYLTTLASGLAGGEREGEG